MDCACVAMAGSLGFRRELTTGELNMLMLHAGITELPLQMDDGGADVEWSNMGAQRPAAKSLGTTCMEQASSRGMITGRSASLLTITEKDWQRYEPW